MEYTLFILLLPFLSFLILGLAGMRMKHQLAGAIGTASLLGVTTLSYLTAFDYFTAGRTAEGVYPTIMPYNFEWLPFTDTLSINLQVDARGHFYRQFDGTHLFLRLYEGRTWIPALLCVPFALYHVHVGFGRSHQHLPDVRILGIGRC